MKSFSLHLHLIKKRNDKTHCVATTVCRTHAGQLASGTQKVSTSNWTGVRDSPPVLGVGAEKSCGGGWGQGRLWWRRGECGGGWRGWAGPGRVGGCLMRQLGDRDSY